MDLKGTRTEANLLAAFAGESQARNKYTFYAAQAKKEGYVQIADIFKETAANEKEHAELWFRLLKGGAVKTIDALSDAAEGEHFEWSQMYREFAEEAERENFPTIATQFRKIAEVEEEHEARYRKLIENIQNNRVFERNEEQDWICSNCGYVHKGKKAPELCPACAHSKAYFKIKPTNY